MVGSGYSRPVNAPPPEPIPPEPTTPALANPWPGIVAVIIHMGMLAAAFSMLATVNSLWLERWGAPAWLIGFGGTLPLAANLVTIFLLLPLLGGRIAPVPLVLLGCAWGVVMVLLMPLADSAVPFLLLRFLTAIGLGFSWLIGESWINLAVPPDKRGRVISLYASVFFAGFAAGPLMVRFFGDEGWAPVVLTVIAVAGATLPLALAWRWAPPISLKGGHGGAFHLWHHARAVGAVAIGAGLAEAICFSLLVNYGLRSGLPEDQALTLMTWLVVGGLLLQFPVGWLADRFSKPIVLALICLGTVGLAAALPLTIGTPVGVAVVFALGAAVLAYYSLGLALMGEQVAPAQMVVANASFLAGYQVGGLLGPAGAGVAMEALPPDGFALALGAVSLMLAVVLLAGRARPSAP